MLRSFLPAFEGAATPLSDPAALVGQVLVPEFSPGDVVVLDNLSSHKAPVVRETI